jgi:biopolymer transport protein ExbD
MSNKERHKERKKSRPKPGDSQIPAITGMKSGGNLDYMNITPMIDVMLVLLIIFMIITPVVMSHSVTLPKTITSSPEKGNHVTLTINKQGQFFLEHNKKAIPENQLTTVLQQQYADKPYDHVLYLKADNRVSYSVVLTAINAARHAGVARIGAITTQVAPSKSRK